MVIVSFTDVKESRICRVPLTEMALLEANAMWAELTSRRQLVDEVPLESRAVELELLNRATMKFMYTPSLTIYSAAVHLVEHYHGITNVAGALEAAGRLATVALNIPSQLVSSLKVSAGLTARWGERVNAMRERADPGFLFLVLCMSAPRFDPRTPFEEWIESTLQSVGLPPAMTLEEWAMKELEALPGRLDPHGQLTERTRSILRIGRNNYSRRGLVVREPLSVNALADKGGPSLPLVVLADESIQPLTPQPITDPLFRPLESLRLADEYQMWASTFVNAIRF
jgi:hypothetical protein